MSYSQQSEPDGVEITSSSSLRDIKQRIGVGKDEELRESEKRRRYLQKLARLVTPMRPAVRMSQLVPTAAVNQGGETEELPDELTPESSDEPLIFMTTRAFEQAVTDYPRRVFDAMVQKALLIHEVGHILYTDSESFKGYLSRVDMDHKRMFKKTWNALEDAAIETQLRREYSVTHELDVLNANLMSEDEIGHRIDDDTLRFSFFQAVTLGILDMGCYNSGLFAKLMDEDNDVLTFAGDDHDRELMADLIPEMEQVVTQVTTEPSSPKRNEYIWEFWQILEEYLDEAAVDGSKESGLESLLDGDGNIGGGGSDGDGDDDDGDGASPIFGKPDDSGGEYGGDARDAYELSHDDVQDAIEEGIRAAMSGGSDGDDDGGSDGDEADVNAPGDEGMDDEKEEQYQQELASEAAELDGGQQMIDEAEQYLDIIKQAAEEAADRQRAKGGREGGPQWNGLTLQIPNRDSYDTDRYRACNQRAKRLARILRNRLQKDRRQLVQRNQRRGKLSTGGGTMMRVERDDYRLFERVEEGKEKDYHAMFVLDRSGSMSGQPARDAEEALGSMALALHEVNENDRIKVSVMDLYQSTARLVLPFGVNPNDKRGNLFNGQTGGGTPLAKCLYLARQRVLEEDSQPFMVVVTDGRPSSLDNYRAELRKANFPVLGIYITDGRSVQGGTHAEDEKVFDQTVYVTDTNEIDQQLMNLCQQVMF